MSDFSFAAPPPTGTDAEFRECVRCHEEDVADDMVTSDESPVLFVCRKCDEAALGATGGPMPFVDFGKLPKDSQGRIFDAIWDDARERAGRY